jgi:hypothetical protein
MATVPQYPERQLKAEDHGMNTNTKIFLLCNGPVRPAIAHNVNAQELICCFLEWDLWWIAVLVAPVP